MSSGEAASRARLNSASAISLICSTKAPSVAAVGRAVPSAPRTSEAVRIVRVWAPSAGALGTARPTFNGAVGLSPGGAGSGAAGCALASGWVMEPMSGILSAGWPTFSMKARICLGSVATVSSAILSRRSGAPCSWKRSSRSSARRVLSSLGIQTSRLWPPSAKRNLREVRNTLPQPMKPGVCWPPPTLPARVEKVMPTGVSSRNSRLTTMTPLHSGT